MEYFAKRSVNKRQAAMDSEKKWQESFDADMMYELSLPLKNFKPPDLTTEANSRNFPEPLSTEELLLDDKEEFTVMKNSFLTELVGHLACSNCMARELRVEIGKNIHGFTQSVQVCCMKCTHELFGTEVEPIHYHFRSPQVVSVEKGMFSSQSDDSVNKTAEVLVCDVDVPDNPFSPCSMNGAYSNQGSYVSDEAYDETPCKTVITPSKSDTTSKPLRPCVFCSKMQSRLRQHVKTAHWNHPFVTNMVRQPPRVQAKLMRQLRSEGILAENKRRLKSGRNDLLRVRNQGSGELTVCGICGGYYKKNVLWRHKSTCTGRPQLCGTSNDVETEDNFMSPGPTPVKDEAELSTWSSPPVTNGAAPDTNDASEIDKIREILEGITHGVFSQSEKVVSSESFNHVKGSQNGVSSAVAEPIEPPNANAHFITNDVETDFNPRPGEIAGFIASLVKPEIATNLVKQEMNEDQLLFDSLPAIINGRDSSAKTSWSDSTEDDWPDIFPDSETIPSYDTCQSKRKKRSRSDFQYQFWKKEHEDRIRNYFSGMVDALKVPGKEACQEFLKNNTDIRTDWVRVKYKVYNEIQKKKKRIKRNTPPSAV